MFRSRSRGYALTMFLLLLALAVLALGLLSALTAANALPSAGATVLAAALLAAACWRAFAGKLEALPAVLEAVAGIWLLCYAALIGLSILGEWLTGPARWAGAAAIAVTLVFLVSTVLAAEALRSVRGADLPRRKQRLAAR